MCVVLGCGGRIFYLQTFRRSYMYRPCHGTANLAMGYRHNHPTSSPPSSLLVVVVVAPLLVGVVGVVVVVVVVAVAVAVADDDDDDIVDVVVVVEDCVCRPHKIGDVVDLPSLTAARKTVLPN